PAPAGRSSGRLPPPAPHRDCRRRRRRRGRSDRAGPLPADGADKRAEPLRRWRWMRADDDAGRAHAAWREFHDDLADFGMTSRPSEPPRTLAARVTTT